MRQTGATGGSANADEHNLGDNNSIYTSWTIFKDVAEQFGSRKGKGGVILSKEFKMSEMVPSPDKFFQGEILIPGVVTGAKVEPAPVVKP